MLNAFNINDTIENLNFRDIKEDCIVCDTHLTSIIEVSWANLFEKKEEQAISYMLSLANVINEIWIPVQLITQSRPKDFSNHIRKIKKTLQKNDYKLKFKKELEWFQLYYNKDLIEWNITEEEIREKYENHPEYIERSMLDSYIERANTMIKNNNILEKRYYFVVSTLEQPKWIEEKDIAKSYEKIYNFKDDEVFYEFKNKLDKKTNHIINIMWDSTWMAIRRKNTVELKNIMFDYFNFPISQKHKINEYITEYWKVPDILDNSIVNKNEKNEENNKLLSNAEKWLNFITSYLFKSEENVLNKHSNNTTQLIKPFSIDDSNMDYLIINNNYSFTIHINRFWDEYLEDLVLWPILIMPYYYDLSVHHIPLNREMFLIQIERKKERIELDYNEKIRGKSSSEAKYLKNRAEQDLEKVKMLENTMRNKKSWYYSTSIDITFRANSEEELLKIKEKVRDKLSEKRIFFSECTGNHLDWFLSTAPLLTNKISGKGKIFERDEHSLEEITHFYPYCPDSINSEKWLWIGISKQGIWRDEIKNILFFDIFDRSRILNSNFFIIWQSGSGKTVFQQQLVRTQELLWHRHLMIDFLWNYQRWAEDTPDRFKVIKIDNNSNDKINPCDIVFPSNEIIKNDEDLNTLSTEEIKEKIIKKKISELSAYFSMFLDDDYNTTTRWILDIATLKTYESKLKNVDILKTKYFWDIMLSDIIKTLNSEKDPDKKQVSKSIASMLDQYATWSFSWMFNSKTNIQFDDKSVVFLLSGNTTNKYKELAILQSFILINNLIHKSDCNNILSIDELSILFNIKSNEVQSLFKEKIAAVRNFDGWVVWMTQFLDQVMNTNAGKEFFKLSTSKMYLSGWLSNNDDELNVFNYDKSLSNSSKNYLLNNNLPWYWVMILGNEQIQMKVDSHPDMSLFKRYKPLKKKF